MDKYYGKSVNQGIVLGKIKIITKLSDTVQRLKIEQVDAELSRLDAAREKALQNLQILYENALAETGTSGAAIFEAYQMLLEDKGFNDKIVALMREESVNAEYAVTAVGERYAQMFAAMEDEYMRGRATDMRDVAGQLVQALVDLREDRKRQLSPTVQLTEPVILVAEDLSPSETMQLDKKYILALVTQGGSATSHTAILARMLNIPALIGVDMEMEQITDRTMAVVDGESGVFIVNPDEETVAQSRIKIDKQLQENINLKNLIGQPSITQSGKQIQLAANISSIEDLEQVSCNDAEGIGLFRSEFLYLGRKDLPSEEEQFEVYKTVVEAMGDKPVIIRTLDIGADKQAEAFMLDKEENPALGYRGVRISLSEPSMFKTQLRALLRAAAYGNLSIMYPMIISTEEVEKILKLVAEVEQDLQAVGIPFGKPRHGIMIETPAAVMISEELAELVDFFSIGTNDLTQYALAIDRQNSKLAPFYNAYHVAVLRMIQMVVQAAHKKGKWVGICGELAADVQMTKQLVEMGVDELSMAPAMILPLRKIIRNLS